jgi:transforming growth factor-beta-induced protein
MLRWMKYLAATAALAFVAACGGGDDDDDSAAQMPGNLAEVATENGFTALLAAVQKAELAGALTDADAELTVFAPTNEAFTALATTLGFADAVAMVNALPKEALAQILTYHVVDGKKTAADIVAAGPTSTAATLYTFEGAAATLAIDTTTGVKITDEVLSTATVTTADVAASNGVIHVIDKVLVPPGVLNLAQMAQLNPAFSILVEAVVTADLAGALAGTDKLTVFAPTNDAFAALLGELDVTKDDLLALPILGDVLLYHVVAGDVRAADVVALTKPADVATLLTGETFTVGADLGLTDANGRTATLVATDVVASNGVIHVIDKVILPTLSQ